MQNSLNASNKNGFFLKKEPNNSSMYHKRGDIYAELNNLDLALKSYEKALKIYPTMQGAKKMVSFLNDLIKGQTT